MKLPAIIAVLATIATPIVVALPTNAHPDLAARYVAFVYGIEARLTFHRGITINIYTNSETSGIGTDTQSTSNIDRSPFRSGRCSGEPRRHFRPSFRILNDGHNGNEADLV